MKPTLLIVVLAAFFAPGCAGPYKGVTIATGGPSVRCEGGIRPSNVAAYRVFKTKIPGHLLGMFIRKDGVQMPMLCKLDGGRIYPLPQSVFANAAGWQIMVEPEIVSGNKHVHSLMSLAVRIDGGAVVMGTSRLKPVTSLPELINSPK